MTIEKKEIDVSESVVAANAAKAEAQAMLEMASMFVVDSHESFIGANDELIALSKKEKWYEAQRKELKAPILEAGRKVDEFFKPAIELLAKTRDLIKTQMVAWQREQERIKREAEESARKELEKAERARIKAIEKGDVEKVAKLEEKVVNIAATVAAVPEAPKAKGFYITEIWSAQVVDFQALVIAAAKDHTLLGCLSPNRPVLDDLAKAHQTNLSIPGVLAVKRDSAGSRSR